LKVLKDDFEKPKYSFFARFLHWCFVIIFAYGIYKQVDDINQLDDISFFRTEIIFASVFLLFLIFRFFYMTKTQKTSIPEDTPKSQKFAAKIVHLSMYICLAGIAISGLLIGYFFFKEKIDFLSLLGIFLIVLSGVFVLYREAQLKINLK